MLKKKPSSAPALLQISIVMNFYDYIYCQSILYDRCILWDYCLCLKKTLHKFPSGYYPAGVTVQVMWQLRRDTNHVPVYLEYSRGVRLGIDKGFLMASLEC